MPYISTKYYLQNDVYTNPIYPDHPLRSQEAPAVGVTGFIQRDRYGNYYVLLEGIPPDGTVHSLTYTEAGANCATVNYKICRSHEARVILLGEDDGNGTNHKYTDKFHVQIKSSGANMRTFTFDVSQQDADDGKDKRVFAWLLYDEHFVEEHLPDICPIEPPIPVENVSSFSDPAPVPVSYGSSTSGRTGRQTISYSSAGRNRPY